MEWVYYQYENLEKIQKISKKSEELRPIPLIDKILSQSEMVAKGGNYHLQHGILMVIPISQIEGLDPEPSMWADDEGYHEFSKGQKIEKPIEVIYNNGKYMLQDGNHRVKQAKLNGDKFIKAFVEADGVQYQEWIDWWFNSN